MTKSHLKQNFTATFERFLLINRNGETIVAASQALPTDKKQVFAYIPAEDDFARISEAETLAVIRNVKLKI